ncbi:MAG: ThuA domain-containing protein [Alphaproteobacteria bacterium]|nr:MAG: ThuA domain-containing protein [Alphaproteobacteria bacterium]
MRNPTLLSALVIAMVASALAITPACAQAPVPEQVTGVPRPPSDPYEGRKKLLVIADVQTGFHHDSINRAMAAIEQMGRESGGWVTFLRTDSQLVTRTPISGQGARYAGRRVNARNLDYFDAVFFLGSGEGTLTAAQKADLLSFVREGKGFVGGHASTIAYYDWPEYGQMLGGEMAGEFPVAPSRLIIADPDFPGVSGFPAVVADQYQYLDESYVPGTVHTILRLDPSQLTAEQLARRPDGNFPVVWARTYGEGRVYVSTFGHLDQTWDDPAVVNLYREGIRWALGLTEAAVPNDQP